MSRVYFHSPSGTAELLGAERAHLSSIAKETARGYVARFPDRFRSLVTPGHYLSSPNWYGQERWARAFETSLWTSGKVIEFDGQPIESYALLLNTALASGDDMLRLAARLDGQCEIHGWVDGPNRGWLADKIEAAVGGGVFRKGLWFEPFGVEQRKWADLGWGDVVGLLRARDDEPVVMSYSVCQRFPNEVIADLAPPLEDDPEGEYAAVREAFSLLPSAERWAAAMTRLRTGYNGLELEPDGWEDFRFMHRLSMLDLAAADWQERLREGAALLAGSHSL